MKRNWRAIAAAGGVLAALSGGTAVAQKPGGVLKMYHFDSPASLSLHEEVTYAALGPAMGLFNNLVMFDQHVPQASLQSIVPDLATEWSWDPSKTELRFRLRDGVKWHDGKPFTANDVKCTWDTLLGKSPEKFRLNPRKAWYQNLEEVTTKGDDEVAFHLKRPQPSFIALLASGWSAVYPCHVTPREMRTHPIGTGPFKLVEFKPNEGIRVTRNPDYWKKERPYLDGIEYTIIKNASTRVLAFIAGKFDMTTPYNLTIPLMRDIQSQAADAICELTPTNVSRNLIVNRDKPPFDNPDVRRALALTLDRKAFIDTINEGKADIGGAMLPPPEGIWGMPTEMLMTLPGYDPDIAKNRNEARKIMEDHGYGPHNRLKITVTTRNIPQYRDPAVILIDQLKQIYIDGSLEEIDTVNWYPKVMRKDFTVGLNLGENGLDDPDQTFYENFACGAERNYTGYCNRELETEFDRQSMEADPEKRKHLVWEIDRKLQEDGARPMIYHNRAASCWYPRVKGLTHHGQQHLQRFALGRFVARPVKARGVLAAAAAAWFFVGMPATEASAQKAGGILKVYNRDSPASMSIIEEATLSTVLSMMGVFNNLVVYDQHVAQNSEQSIVPELATDWSWSEDGTRLTFKLREGVKWHDGKPFTAADVKCTWDLLTGRATEKLRINPRRSWYSNLEEVVPDGDYKATFVLKRPQPALLAMLASGLAPVYPCHIPPRDMRSHPIGTGPFKFVEFRPNESIRVTRNPDYWKKDRPYLDGIDYTVVPNRSTALLGFVAGKFDMTWPYDVAIPLLKDVQSQAPQAICEITPLNASRNLIINRKVPPFDNPEIRRAMALSLDRKAFIDILDEGQGDIGGAMLPPPAGVWGLPPEMLKGLPGYDPDVEKSRAEARRIMEREGYGPDNRLRVKLSVRNIPIARDPAIILTDQLKTIYIDAELDPIETVNWFPKAIRKDYVVGLNLTAAAVDDPDQQFFENYACGAERNITGYCNPELEKQFERQSVEPDREKRKKLVWQIDRKLQEDGARPIIFHYRAASCRQPYVKGLTIMVNSIYNGWRFEDVWLDR